LLATTAALLLAAAPVRSHEGHDHGKPAEGKLTATPAPAPVRTAQSPILEIESVEHEFGKVTPGEPLIHTFKFKNKGKSDLQITEVKPSCGCTKGDFDKVVKPGKTGKITLSIDKTEKYVGKTVKTAHVTTNDPEHLSFTLTMRADFVPKAPTAAATQ
jgi:hypothetical protein